MFIEIFAECFRIFSIFFLEIIVRLSSLRVIVISFLYPCGFLIVLTNKDVFACLALVPLSARLSAIFPDGEGTTGDALFLGIKNWEENSSYLRPKVFKSSLIFSLYTYIFIKKPIVIGYT